MQVIDKLSLSLRVLIVFSTGLILLAIIYGARGSTYQSAKAALKVQYQLAVLEADYQTSIRGRNLAFTLPKVFYNEASRYSIRYPSSWEMTRDQPGILMLNGKEGTMSFYSNINVQALKTQQAGGMYTDAHHFIDSLKKQRGVSNIRILETGPLVLYLLDSTPVQGEYAIFTYSVYGLAFKQWQVAIQRSDGQVLYVWAFNAPLTRFQDDYPVAKAMLKSFNYF